MFLALLPGLNEPQLPAGAQLQVTPAFAESLLTTAVSVAVALVCNEAGGALNATEIWLCGGLLLLLPLQPMTMAAKLRLKMARLARGSFTACLPLIRSQSLFRPWTREHGLPVLAPGILAHFEW